MNGDDGDDGGGARGRGRASKDGDETGGGRLLTNLKQKRDNKYQLCVGHVNYVKYPIC